MTKQQWRARLLAARRARSAAELAIAHRRITAHLLRDLAMADRRATGPGPGPGSRSDAAGRADAAGHADSRPGTICVYLPLRTEPLAPELPELLAAADWRVLVPVARRGEPLDWCALAPGRTVAVAGTEASGSTANAGSTATAGGLVIGGYGIAEPTGPRLGITAIADADVVLVPALAVDRAGVRLGRGGGFYDRSLPLATGANGVAPRLIAVIFDEEWVPSLPGASHDVPVTDVVTPSRGICHVAD